VAANPEYILGIDLGATQLRFILADKENGNLYVDHGNNSKESFPSPLSENGKICSDPFIAHIPDINKVSAYVARKLETYLTELGVEKKAVRGIGISVAGSVHSDGRFIGSNVPLRYAQKISDLYGVDLITGLKAIFPKGVTIIVENDGNCAGVAQGIYYEQMGLAPNKTFFITVSTGIGGGGPKRDIDEVGHIIVDGYYPRLVPVCGCGACGCIEAYASGEGIKNQAVSILDLLFKNSPAFEEFNDFECIRTGGLYNLYEIVHRSHLKSLYIDEQGIDAKTVFDFANLNKVKDTTDEFAYYLVEIAAERFAKVLFSLSNIHGIERFGIGGSVAINNPGYLDIVRQKMKTLRRSEDIFKSCVKIEVSPLGEYVTDYGALLLAVDSSYKKNWIDTIIKMQQQEI
jgi:predicted NBD/HSP70 family sugar kinase